SGAGDEYAYAVEVDRAGSVYVAGRAAPGFPTTPGVLQPVYDGNGTAGSGHGQDDGFVAKLTADGGGLVWATYFGTAQDVRDIDVDAQGNVYLTTWFDSSVGQAPFDPAWFANGWHRTIAGGSDAVAAKISADASRVVWATYL